MFEPPTVVQLDQRGVTFTMSAACDHHGFSFVHYRGACFSGHRVQGSSGPPRDALEYLRP